MATAELLIMLFGTSDDLGGYLTRHPEFLDELVLSSVPAADEPADSLAAHPTAALGAAGNGEEWFDALRRFRNAEFLRIALDDLCGVAGPEATAARITRVDYHSDLDVLFLHEGGEIRAPATLSALSALTGRGLLADEEATALAAGYAFLRRVDARLRLLLDRSTSLLPREEDRLRELARGLGYRGADAGNCLAADVGRHRGAARRAYLRITEGVAP